MLVKNRDTLYIYSLYLLAFFIPSGIYKLEGAIIAITLILWVASKQYKNFKYNNLIFNLLLPIFLILYFISLLRTQNFTNGIKQITMHLPYVLVPILLTSNLITNKVKKNIFLVFIFSTLLFITIAYFYALFDIIQTKNKIIRINLADYNKFKSYGLTRVFRGYHPTFISLFLNFSLIVILKNRVCFSKLISKFLLAYILISVFLLDSMLGILCAIIIIFFYFLGKKSNLNRVLIVLFFVLFGLINYVYNPLKLSKLDKFKKTKLEITDIQEKRNVLNLRLVKWISSIEIAKDNLLFGVTPGDLKRKLAIEYKNKNYEYAYLHKFGPHNQYIQIFTAFGIIGLMYFLITLFLPIFSIHTLDNLYIWFIVIVGLYFLTDDILERQQGIIFFSFFYSLLLNKTK